MKKAFIIFTNFFRSFVLIDQLDSLSTKKAEENKKGLPLQVARKVELKTDEGSCISLEPPDEQEIVFDLLGNLFAIPSTGGKADQLTKGLAFDSHPRYSPDGKNLVFIPDRRGWK